MRIGSRIKTWWQKKSTKYAAAGTLLLALAGAALALSLGTGAQAAEITLGEKNLTLEQDSDGAYLIKNAEDLNALRTATEDQTENNTFRLSGDLDITSITTAATGTFAGIFDGGGHVITIGDININTAKTKVGAAEGVLFGTVTGTVQNLIVDITDPDASYTRESDAGVTETPGTDPSSTTEDVKYTPETPVSEASSGEKLDAYNNIKDYETVYIDQNGTVSEDPGSGGTAYKRYTAGTSSSVTNTYEAKNPTANSFGIICGTLSESGDILQVSVNGENLHVSQSVAANEKTTSETVTKMTPEYHYYKIGTGEKYTTESQTAGSVQFKAPEYYEKLQKTVPDSNAAVGNRFSIQVSAPKQVATDEDGKYTIEYQVTVTPKTDVTVGQITLKSDDVNVKIASGNSNSTTLNLSDGGSKTVEFSYTGTCTGSSDQKNVRFTAAETIDGQSVTASSDVTTEIKRVSSVEKSGENAGLAANALQIQVSAPKAVALNNGSASWEYVVTLTKKEPITGNVILTYPTGVTPSAGQGVTTGSGNQMTISSESWAGKSVTLQFTGSASAAGAVFSTFTASGSDANGQTVAASASVSVKVADTTLSGNGTLQTEGGNTGLAEISVSTPVLVEEADDQIVYTIEIKNISNVQLENVKVEDDEGTGTWNSDTSGNSYMISSIPYQETVTLTYTCSGSFSDGSADAGRSFTVSYGTDASVPISISGTVYRKDTPVTDSGDSVGVAEKSLTLNASTDSPVGYDSGSEQEVVLTYTVEVSAPLGETVQVTAVLPETAGGTGQWSDLQTDGNVTSFESGGAEKTLIYTWTAGTTIPEEFSIGFSVRSEDPNSGIVRTAKTEGLSTSLIDEASVENEAKDNQTITAGELTLTAKAPSAVTVENGQATITYSLTVTNGTDSNQTVTLSTDENGTWKEVGSTGQGTSGTSTTVTVDANVPKQITYTRNVSGTLPSESVTAWFQGTVTGEEKTVMAKITGIQTDLYSQESSSTVTKNGVTATLARDRAYVTGNGTVTYTLTLTNTGREPIKITTALTGWDSASGSGWSGNTYLSDGADESEKIQGNIIETGSSVVLEKRISVDSLNSAQSAGVSLDITYDTINSSEITTYRYVDSSVLPTGTPVEGEPSTMTTQTGTAIYAGNHLYAGVFAGAADGRIEKARQDVELEAEAAASVSNGAEMAAGGVTGRAIGTINISDLYVKGGISGSNGALTGLVAGSSDGTGQQKITRGIVEEASEASELGAVSGEGVLLGPDAEPGTDWGNWSSFDYYISEEQKEEGFDLGWLVKTGENILELSEPDGSGKVSLNAAEAEEGRLLNWRSVYRARKTLTDQERQAYYTEEASWELGDSGYYEAVHAYATDGYYHFVRDFADQDSNYETIYPYTGTAPTFAAENPWSVVRKNDGSLDDVIRLKLTTQTVGDVEIYNKNGEKMDIESFSVDFPFTEAEMQITAIPMRDGKIYEEIQSPEYTTDSREPLPRPELTSESYYNSDGTPIEKEFEDGGSYEAGTVLNLENTGNSCAYAYFFSDAGPDEDKGIQWTGDGETRRTTGAEIFDAAYSAAWTECRVSLQIPETLEGTNYLYIKVSRENYPDTIYCFGSFQVDTPAEGIPRLYYDEGVGTEITDGKVASGDTLVFERKQSAALTDLQYVISGVQLSGGSLYEAEWKDYSGPVQIPDSNGSAACYIYSRMKDSAGAVYGPITSYVYTYVEESAGAEASPRTGTVSGTGEVSGASIASGSVVYLESSTQEARILYLVNTSASTKLELQRVNGNTEGLTEDGHYFKAGNRWYYTELEGVQVYEEGALVLYNEIDSAQTQYVHTVVIGDNLEPSESISYIYSVQTMGQVSAPESTLPTRYYPGGSEAEIAQVEKDTYLSFTSLTPNAELYYVIGNGTVSDQEDEATGTRKYDSSVGILVDADYGSQFVVSIKAVRWNADHTKKEMRDSETVQFVFEVAEQGLALTPTATPATTAEAPTTVLPGEKILLSTATRGGSVYYTTDGSAPQVIQGTDGSWQAAGNSTKLYDAGTGIAMPEEGTGFFTIRAVAVHPDLGVSPEAQFVYAFPDAVQSPYANIPSGSVDEGTEIILRNRTEGATIYYTVGHNGENPADPTISSTVFEESQPIIVEGKTVVKAIAVKDGVKSEIITFTYGTMKQLSAPEASIASGSMVSRGTRLTLSAAEGASIYYTTDGSDPLASDNSAVIAGDSLILDGTAGAQVTVKAYARKDGSSASEVVTFTYQISQSVSGVTADVASGSQVSNGSKVNLMTDVTGAVIYYTTDGSDPAENGVEGTVVTINGTAGSTYTIKAVAVVNGEAGTAATFTYRIKEKPTAPGASPSGGVLTVAVRVTLSSSAEKIYYTTDGTTPTESSTLYTEPVLINRTTELKAIAVSEDGETSEVSTFQYTAAQKASAPTASMEDGSVLDPGTVLSLSTETSGAEIYYSTDGTEPTLDNLENLLQFNGDGITVNRTVTVKAVAYREDLQLSDVSEYNYTVETIPAVEQKRAEEERLAEQGLHDTDASALERNQDYDSVAYGSRVLKEDEYHTVVLSSGDSIPDRAVLVTEEKEYSQKALENVKQVFGETYTILNSYEIYLMQGGAIIQPDGPVEIGVPIPAEYENAAVTLIRIEEENKLTRLETRRKDGMVYAEVEHFSHYALVGVADPENAGEPFDYLLILEAAAGLSVILGMGYLIRQRWKKYRNSR